VERNAKNEVDGAKTVSRNKIKKDCDVKEEEI